MACSLQYQSGFHRPDKGLPHKFNGCCKISIIVLSGTQGVDSSELDSQAGESDTSGANTGAGRRRKRSVAQLADWPRGGPSYPDDPLPPPKRSRHISWPAAYAHRRARLCFLPRQIQWSACMLSCCIIRQRLLCQPSQRAAQQKCAPAASYMPHLPANL
jgi:hypothetical protein